MAKCEASLRVGYVSGQELGAYDPNQDPNEVSDKIHDVALASHIGLYDLNRGAEAKAPKTRPDVSRPLGKTDGENKGRKSHEMCKLVINKPRCRPRVLTKSERKDEDTKSKGYAHRI